MFRVKNREGREWQSSSLPFAFIPIILAFFFCFFFFFLFSLSPWNWTYTLFLFLLQWEKCSVRDRTSADITARARKKARDGQKVLYACYNIFIRKRAFSWEWKNLTWFYVWEQWIFYLNSLALRLARFTGITSNLFVWQFWYFSIADFFDKFFISFEHHLAFFNDRDNISVYL